ncbi:hypothetical protein FA95DRAFT_1279776 [Auriscalpium vulgare]|uniref:Uncharacterized protein n=1 Tax=Auriscalpium vulgare TaxID=40419 RepID=A0ACB8R279_9AGAM|nr:hypothetical protein FA95DRAFT_1279776 [Auriscalpium vulgare]
MPCPCARSWDRNLNSTVQAHIRPASASNTAFSTLARLPGPAQPASREQRDVRRVQGAPEHDARVLGCAADAFEDAFMRNRDCQTTSMARLADMGGIRRCRASAGSWPRADSASRWSATPRTSAELYAPAHAPITPATSAPVNESAWALGGTQARRPRRHSVDAIAETTALPSAPERCPEVEGRRAECVEVARTAGDAFGETPLPQKTESLIRQGARAASYALTAETVVHSGSAANGGSVRAEGGVDVLRDYYHRSKPRSTAAPRACVFSVSLENAATAVRRAAIWMCFNISVRT